jgi:hypothetical protein
MRNLRISFTGTRQGMSEYQKAQFAAWISVHKDEILSFTHGSCIGADVEAHEIVSSICGQCVFIHIWPSNDPKTRVKLMPSDNCRVEMPKNPTARNLDIVKGSDLLLATPLGRRTPRGGTWNAVAKAEKLKIPVKVFERTR